MVYPWYDSAGSWNNTLWHYKNPEVDKVLDVARASTDKAVQAKLYGRSQELALDDPPGSVIFVQNFACGARCLPLCCKQYRCSERGFTADHGNLSEKTWSAELHWGARRMARRSCAVSPSSSRPAELIATP